MGNHESKVAERGIKYKPLKTKKNQFRLLKFQKRDAKTSAVIRVTLHTVSFDVSPNYHCVSYVWGSPELNWPIYVNGDLVEVTTSLGQALSQLERRNDFSALWVDGLCINQRDKSERAEQVLRMSDIYTKCIANFAWLGLGDSQCCQVLDTIDTVGVRVLRTVVADQLDWLRNQMLERNDGEESDQNEFRELAELMRPDNVSDVRCAFKMNSDLNRELVAMFLDNMHHLTEKSYYQLRTDVFASLELDEQGLAAVWRQFFTLTFWQRIWIVQELVLPNAVILLCGKDSTRLDYLLAIWHYVDLVLHTDFKNDSEEEMVLSQQINELSAILNNAQVSLKVIAETRQNRDIGEEKRKDKDTIHALLNHCSSLSATVHLDKVFGVMSISTDLQAINDSGLVQYDIPLRTLGIEVMKLTLLRHGLSYLQEGKWLAHPDSAALAGWPSWVNISDVLGTFNDGDGYRHIHQIRHEYIPKQFTASGSETYKLTVHNFGDSNILRVPCRIVGRVERVHDSLDRSWKPGDEIAQLEMVKNMVKEVETFFHQEKNLEQALHGKPLWWVPCLQPDVRYAKGFEDKWRVNMESYKAQYEAFTTGRDYSFNCLSWRSAIISWIEAYSPFTIGAPCRYVGLGARNMRSGDTVAILPEVDAPYILRPTRDGRYRLIGEAYVLGIMNGEFIEVYPDTQMIEIE